MDIPPELMNPEGFLNEFRGCAGVYGVQLNWNYFKNKRFRDKSGITEDEIQEILLKKLRPEHCRRGPMEERNIEDHPPGVIYEFIYSWKSYKIYFKLKIAIEGSFRVSLCMSCHASDI